uniref:Expressed protein n=1 Tax=Schizophyllum commune (strain H4-8 / FGSC 9210) TaxID=578458 RepID=D8PYR2_SCHCM
MPTASRWRPARAPQVTSAMRLGRDIMPHEGLSIDRGTNFACIGPLALSLQTPLRLPGACVVSHGELFDEGKKSLTSNRRRRAWAPLNAGGEISNVVDAFEHRLGRRQAAGGTPAHTGQRMRRGWGTLADDVECEKEDDDVECEKEGDGVSSVADGFSTSANRRRRTRTRWARYAAGLGGPTLLFPFE